VTPSVAAPGVTHPSDATGLALKLCGNKQVQALAHYDDVRLKSEKVGIHILTYQLPRAADHSESDFSCLNFSLKLLWVHGRK